MTTLIWTCEYCREPIEDGDGHVFIETGYIDLYRDLTKRGCDGPISAADLIATSPERPRWEVAHRACDPSSGRTTWWQRVEDLRTAESMMDLTAHLLSNDWLPLTNWDTILRDAARQLAR